MGQDRKTNYNKTTTKLQQNYNKTTTKSTTKSTTTITKILTKILKNKYYKKGPQCHNFSGTLIDDHKRGETKPHGPAGDLSLCRFSSLDRLACRFEQQFHCGANQQQRRAGSSAHGQWNSSHRLWICQFGSFPLDTFAHSD